MAKVVVVTGGNRGIGYETCKQIAKKGFTVVLTARDSKKGKEAVEKLTKRDLDVIFHRLDVTSASSIDELKSFLKKTFGKIYALVNSAGVLLDKRRNVMSSGVDIYEETFKTNLYGPLLMSQKLFDIIERGGRIVNVSSRAGQIGSVWGGYPAYSVSKSALNSLTVKLAVRLKSKGIKVNSASPGWVRTDMGGQFATRSVNKGAETIVWLATAKKIPTGKFFHDKKEISW